MLCEENKRTLTLSQCGALLLGQDIKTIAKLIEVFIFTLLSSIGSLQIKTQTRLVRYRDV